MSAIEVLAAEERELRARPAGLTSLGADHQTFLAHVLRSRTAQKLPPFFALLTGPTLQQPYRLEELSVTLGRITQNRRLADIHVSDNTTLAHLHAQIEFRINHNHYVLVNHSTNGCKLKTIESDEWTELREPDDSAPLPNPAMIELGGAFVFFQVFYIGRDDRKPQRIMLKPLDLPSAYSATSGKSSSSSKASRAGGPAFVDLIIKALNALGGRATQRQIAEYVETTWPDIAQRSNWRNSVSGVLSVNTPEIFDAEPVVLPNGKRARYMMWALRRRPSDEPVASGSPSVVFNTDMLPPPPPPPMAPTLDVSEETDKKPPMVKAPKKKPGPKPGWKLALAAAQAAASAGGETVEVSAPKKKSKKSKAPKD